MPTCLCVYDMCTWVKLVPVCILFRCPVFIVEKIKRKKTFFYSHHYENMT